MKTIKCLPLLWGVCYSAFSQTTAYIRINQIGYPCKGVKVAVLGSKDTQKFNQFVLIDAATKQPVFKGTISSTFGKYGPFINTYRIDFSDYKKQGKYFLQAGLIISPTFSIND